MLWILAAAQGCGHWTRTAWLRVVSGSPTLALGVGTEDRGLDGAGQITSSPAPAVGPGTGDRREDGAGRLSYPGGGRGDPLSGPTGADWVGT